MNSSHLQNMKLAIFDFDGTIADTSEGIIDSHIFTLRKIKRPVPNDAELRSLIGDNLLRVYVSHFGLNEAHAKEAIKIYRTRYADVGIHKAVKYPGLDEMLVALKEYGIKLGIATLKAEVFAKQMLEEMNINSLFDCVFGMNSDDEFSKADLIQRCMEFCNVSNDATVLIGDSENDYTGAINSNIAFIGVTYGFGFKPEEKYSFITIDSPNEITRMIGVR